MKSQNIENNKLKYLKNELSDYFNFISETINLDDHWSIDKSIEIEIKKSFIRGVLRYSPISYEITQELKNFFIDNFYDQEKLEWITLPYPMIHLANDLVEADGGFHYDFEKKNGKNLITFWMQLTDYNYDSLSFIKNLNLINSFSKIFIKFKLLNFLSKKIQTSKDKIYFWYGNEIHKGNLNTSVQKTCAIQLKVTKDVYEYEQVQEIQKQKQVCNTFIKYKKNEILELFNQYNDLIQQVLKENKINNLYEFTSSQLGKLKKNMSLSFALSTFSQRMFASNKFFNLKNIQQKSSIFDMLSLLIGSSNLICLKRLKNSGMSEIVKNLKSIDKFETLPYESKQFKQIINDKNYSLNNFYF